MTKSMESKFDLGYRAPMHWNREGSEGGEANTTIITNHTAN